MIGRVIDVSRDYEGLRIAAGELFEEEFIADGIRIDADDPNLDNIERLLRDQTVRTVAEGYFERLRYLLWLESTLEFGAPAGLSPLLRDEVEGMRAVRSARAEFSRRHPSCPNCGELNNASAFSCRGCGKDLRKR
jgi:hypothetical protein